MEKANYKTLHTIRFHFGNILEMQNKYEEQSDMVMVLKGKTGILTVTQELFCNLTLSMSILWLWSCHTVLQDVTLSGNRMTSTQKLPVLFLNDYMWIYSHPKIDFFFLNPSQLTKKFIVVLCWWNWLNLVNPVNLICCTNIILLLRLLKAEAFL